MRRAAFIAAALSMGCAPGVPDNPTWLADVRPIVAANCIRCHGVPALGGAPATFRLDQYDDEKDEGGNLVRFGAGSMAEFMAARTAHIGGMPPRGTALAGYQKDTIDAWAIAKAPPGGPAAGNHAPVVAVTVTNVADAFSFSVDVEDADFDIVRGSLIARRGGAKDVVIGELHNGPQTLALDTSTLVPGAYTVTASVNDGGDAQTAQAQMTVAHANTAPTFVLLSPGLNAVVTGMLVLRFRFDDPDTDTQPTAVIQLMRGGTEILSRTVKAPTGVTQELNIDTTGVADGPSYHLFVTVTDEKDVARKSTFTSDKIIISHSTTTETYASVKDIVGFCITCHGGLPSGPDFAKIEVLRSYSGLAWRKVWQLREQPPKSWPYVVTKVTPDAVFTEDMRKRLAEWFLAGAPE